MTVPGPVRTPSATKRFDVGFWRLGHADPSAECLRRIDVADEGRLILVRHGEDCQQTLEGLEIPSVHGCGDRLLHQMIAWDESGVGCAHRRPAFVCFSTLLCKPRALSHRPIVKGSRIGKQAAQIRVAVGAGSGVAQPAEYQGEIGAERPTGLGRACSLLVVDARNFDRSSRNEWTTRPKGTLRVLAASTRRTACCGFVSNHDRRAYFRIVPIQLAEGRDWFRA
jgi:hypothetical protein